MVRLDEKLLLTSLADISGYYKCASITQQEYQWVEYRERLAPTHSANAPSCLTCNMMHVKMLLAFIATHRNGDLRVLDVISAYLLAPYVNPVNPEAPNPICILNDERSALCGFKMAKVLNSLNGLPHSTYSCVWGYFLGTASLSVRHITGEHRIPVEIHWSDSDSIEYQ
jgi:hypothetical protein